MTKNKHLNWLLWFMYTVLIFIALFSEMYSELEALLNGMLLSIISLFVFVVEKKDS